MPTQTMTVPEYRSLIGGYRGGAIILLPVEQRTALPKSRYRSKLESDFAKVGYLYVTDQKVIEVQYEPVTFYIPGGRYKPDFCLITENEMLWIECKGSRKQKNYRDSRSKLRAVAAIYRGVRFYRFFQAMRIKGTWEIEEIR